MPANLTPEYRAAEARFRAAGTDAEKLEALEDMYATIPKHKGTEKMRADIKRRISKFRDSGSGHTDNSSIVKKGDGQIVLIGPPNSGKSSIISALTSVETEVSDYPYTTRIPLSGMVEYNHTQIQLVDTPSISAEHPDDSIINLARSADAVGVVLDGLDYELLDKFEEIRTQLPKQKIAFVLVNKIDLPDARENFSIFKEQYGDEFVVCGVSVYTEECLQKLKDIMLASLGIM